MEIARCAAADSARKRATAGPIAIWNSVRGAGTRPLPCIRRKEAVTGNAKTVDSARMASACTACRPPIAKLKRRRRRIPGSRSLPDPDGTGEPSEATAFGWIVIIAAGLQAGSAET